MDIIVTIPHSVLYDPAKHPNGFLLYPEVLNRHVDAGTDYIYTVADIPTIIAEYPRWHGDVNRSRYNRTEKGVITLVDPQNLRARRRMIDNSEAMLDAYWNPFHEELTDRLAQYDPANSILVDGHSMDPNGNGLGEDAGARPDICLMTREGTSCSKRIIDVLSRPFRELGLRVAIDNPYEGCGIIMTRAIDAGFQAIGIEINEGLYRDDDGPVRQRDMTVLHGAVQKAFADLRSL